MKIERVDYFVRRADYVVWKVVEGKGILLNLENGAYFNVDPVGLTIWRLCNGSRKISRIKTSVSEAFKADPRKVSKDVDHFINELKHKKLIETKLTPLRAITRN